MSNSAPVAVINGIEKFGADKLVEKLKLNDIEVIVVGEFTGKLGDLVDKAEYYFDFVGEVEVWNKAKEDNAKLVVVGINRSIELVEDLKNLGVNWRIINIHGVYGAKMETEKGSGEELGYLIEAIKLAVGNKNLVLPTRKEVLRLVNENDLTEVIMRSCFLSGTEGEIFEIWGPELNSEDLAKVLIDEAKMTRLKVEESSNFNLQSSINKLEIESEWKKLRWKPGENWAESMKETLQAYFVMADEENRKPKEKKQEVKNKNQEEEKKENKKKFEVEVEEEIEEVEEIKPILVKNSNMRTVAENDELKIIPQGDFRLGANYEFEKAKELLKKPEVVIEEKKVEVKKVEPRIKINFNWMKWGWRGMLAIWGIVIVMVVIWVINVGLMWGNINKIETLVIAQKYSEVNVLIKKTTKIIKKQEDGVEGWGWNRLVWGRRYQETLKILDQGMVLADKLVTLSNRSELISKGIFEDKDIDWDKEMTGLKSDLMETEDALGNIGARLSGDWRWVPIKWREKMSNLSQNLSQLRNEVGQGVKFVGILPEMLGTDGKRREYMVLFQNENELRPTGGFVGSYGIISFEGGKLINFEIKDIYQADGQLKGHVEPPQPIKDYLGEGGWYMRDANWQADFPGSAKDIQWFLEKETGRKVDGVIGMNLAVAKSILGVLGEVYVPDFKEKINKNNLYEQAEFYSETNSFAGSDQKASFLGGLGKQLFESIKELKGQQKLELIKAMLDSLEKNELLMSLNDSKTAGVVADLGWNGAMYQGKCPTMPTASQSDRQACFADYLFIVEANLGVNKTNYFLYRNIDESIDLKNQSVERSVKITYENTSKSTNWPGGDYKNYIRVYVPKSTDVTEVSVVDPNGGQKTVFSGDNLKINTVLDRKEIGFLINVPIGKKRVVELKYSDQIDFSTKEKFSYINYIQKQPGYGDTGMVTLVSIPEGWQVNQVEPLATLVNGKLLFNQKLDKNIKMGVEIVK